MNKHDLKNPFQLLVSWVLLIFAVLFGLLLFLVIANTSYYTSAPIKLHELLGISGRYLVLSLLAISLISLVVGVAVSVYFSRRTLRPIRAVMKGLHAVANGDFSVQLEPNNKSVGDVQELARDFNKMVRALDANDAMQRDFMGSFSHELRTPLTSISGFAKLLRDKDFSEEERREYLAVIIAESERLTALSVNMLNLSKFEALEIVTDKRRFWLDEQIRLIVMLLEPKWSAKALHVSVDLDAVVFDGNEEFTRHIWTNLLDNAIKFSDQGGDITVKLTGRDGKITFSVQDTGPGMDAQTQAHVFDKFYQGDASRAGMGYGLGLALVKRAAELCGGSVSLRSTPKQGSVFSVTLPSTP
jgi:signal transduction histidine kinase